MNHYSEEFFTSRQRTARTAAGEVVPFVLDLVRPRSVIDVGCAMGEWLSVFRDHGVEDFHGIDGDYVQRDALPEESGEPDLSEMPRLVFHFDRRALGRLRMLIDFINDR